MREIITIHVGQAGIQLGNACWELFCLEHNIQPDGFKPSQETDSKGEDDFQTFFSETSDPSKFTARSIFMDLEPEAIDHLKTATHRELFSADQMISEKEGTGHNFARGYRTVGRQHIDGCLDRIRKVADQCQNLQGFVVFSSLGGGTGSGLGSLLLENLSTEYEKKKIVSVPIYPSAQSSTSTVEPYNTMLGMRYQRDHPHLATIMDNEAIYGINTKHLQIEKPNYENLNHVIAQMVGSIFTYQRNLAELKTCLVPYPRMHFILSAYAPFVPEVVLKEQMTGTELALRLFSADYMSIKCDPNQGKYFAVNMFYRGDFVPRDIGYVSGTIKNRLNIQFVDWCPTGFTCGIDYNPPVVVPGSKIRPEKQTICLFANSSAVCQVFSRTEEEFDKMYKNRAFLQWYLSEGMEEGDFVEAKEKLVELCLDYREAEIGPDEEGEEEEADF